MLFFLSLFRLKSKPTNIADISINITILLVTLTPHYQKMVGICYLITNIPIFFSIIARNQPHISGNYILGV